MEASYQALLSGDAAAFEALIQQLMSADNEARKQAESLLDQLKQHSTDLVVGNLMRLMRQSQNPASRDMGAVMLRKVSDVFNNRMSCSDYPPSGISVNITPAGSDKRLAMAEMLQQCPGTCHSIFQQTYCLCAMSK